MPRVATGSIRNAPIKAPAYRLDTGVDVIRLDNLGKGSPTSKLSNGTITDALKLDYLARSEELNLDVRDEPTVSAVTKVINSTTSSTGTDSGGAKATIITGASGGTEFYNMPEDFDPETRYEPPPPPPPPPKYTPPKQTPWEALGMTYKEWLIETGGL